MNTTPKDAFGHMVGVGLVVAAIGLVAVSYDFRSAAMKEIKPSKQGAGGYTELCMKGKVVINVGQAYFYELDADGKPISCWITEE